MTNPRTLRRFLVFVVLIGTGGAWASGLAHAPQAPPATQSAPPAQAQPPSPPAFRLSTTVVEVDATVTDKNGRFVDSLTLNDFELLDEGVPQPIRVLFRVVGSSVTTLAPLPIASADAGGGAGGVVRTPDQAQLEQRKPPQRVYVLFFDQEHLDQSSFKYVQAAAETFLAKQFQDGDVGGVLMGSTMVGNKLTTDRQALVAAVKTAKLNPGPSILRGELALWPRMAQAEAIRIALFDDQRILEQVADRAARESKEGGRNPPDLRPTIMEKSRLVVSQLRQTTFATLRAMQALLNGLARVPGRKSVMFMTEGFFFEESWADLRMLVGQAARANVRIYTIDALGLRRGSDGTELSSMNPLETGGQVPLGAYNTTEDGPNTLANDTGGYVVRHTNDFAAAMTEVARDAASYYVLGFSPPESAQTGQFRNITVKVKRSGVQVRARRGYLSMKAGAAPAPISVIPAAPAPAPTPSAAKAAAETPEPAAKAPASGAVEAAAGVSAPLPANAIPLRPDTESRVRDLASKKAASGEAKTLASQGWDRYGRGDLEGAESLLSQAARQEGAAPWVFYALGFTELGLKKPDKAAESWEHVRAAVPAFAPVYLDLADAYLQIGNPAQAVDVLRAAELKWPKDLEVLNALGTVQVRRGSSDDAIKTFERAIAADPKDSLAYLNAAKTYELRYYQLRRFSQPQARWMDDPQLRQKAIENYETYLKLGGPYEAEARTALDRLRSAK
jgi:VWFA-related protein